jgi:vacuolar-type H+-ATPase subunit E/Vma4
VGAETLLGEVEERQKKALEQLEADYATREAEIAKHKAEQISSIAESAKKEASELAEKERARVSGVAKLQAKKIVFDSAEKMLENNILALKQVLAGYAESKDYPELLSRMVRYASKRLGGGVGVICRPSDAVIMKRLGAKTISSDLNSIGGFKAESEDGYLELDLTFEEILRNHEEEVRAHILGKE